MKSALGEFSPVSPVNPPPPPIMLTGEQWWYLIVMLQRLFWFQTEGVGAKREIAQKILRWIREHYNDANAVGRYDRSRHSRLAAVLSPLRSMFATNLATLSPLIMDASGILAQLEWATDHAPSNRVIRALFMDAAKNMMPPFTIQQLMGDETCASDTESASTTSPVRRRTAPSHRAWISDEERAAAAALAEERRAKQPSKALLPRKTPIKILP